jgi:hypothetical protein
MTPLCRNAKMQSEKCEAMEDCGAWLFPGNDDTRLLMTSGAPSDETRRASGYGGFPGEIGEPGGGEVFGQDSEDFEHIPWGCYEPSGDDAVA